MKADTKIGMTKMIKKGIMEAKFRLEEGDSLKMPLML